MHKQKEIMMRWDSKKVIELVLPHLKHIISKDYAKFWDSTKYAKYREQLNICGYYASAYLSEDPYNVQSIVTTLKNTKPREIYIPDRVIFPIKFNNYPHFGEKSFDDIFQYGYC